MIRINLLETQRAPAEKSAAASSGSRFKLSVSGSMAGIAAAAVIAAAIGFIGYKYWAISHEISNLQAANADADKQLKDLEAALKTIDQYQAKKKVLEQRVQVISDLKRRQSVPVHLLDQISKQLPEFLWLDGMDEKANAISMKGKATTYNAVSNFYNNLKDSPFFSDVTLGTTQRATEGVSFQLSCKFIPPDANGNPSPIESDQPAKVEKAAPAPKRPARPKKG